MQTLEQLQQVKQLFLAALEREPHEREAFLRQTCSGEPALQCEVESLLAAYLQDEDFLQSPAIGRSAAIEVAAEVLSEAQEPPVTRNRLGQYRIVREIGCGGMGVVYLAARDDGQYEQQVAIKLIKRGMDTQALLRRFRKERQILAALNHPNIARLLDGGQTADGLPFLVMDYIEGLPIDEYAKARGLSIDERLKLFRSVCDAVDYVHRHQMVHRDLKPGNIVITTGTPKLLDFGIAKLLGVEPDTQSAEMTVTALRVMTPEYASPEQLRGLAVTPASDVYSLGVLLFELLTGERPYHFTSRLPAEILKRLLDSEPVKPSVVITREDLSSAANGKADAPRPLNSGGRSRNETSDTLRRKLRGDLDNIVLMALRKEPDRRYASVRHLSEDLGRHLAGLPVKARRDTLWYRSAKLFDRHKTYALVTLAVALLFLLIGLSLGLSFLRTQPIKPAVNTSIAVLPLVNSDQSTEYLSDGITEGLINDLSQLPGLTVPSRNSVFLYKGQTINPQAISNTLGVKAVLTGTVGQKGEFLFIKINLIDALTNQLSWSNEYIGKTSELLSIQRQIVRDVSNSLDLGQDIGQPVRSPQQGTEDVEAYRLYLKGQYFFNRRDGAFLTKGIEYFQQAIDKDPQYALAYSGRANCCSLLGAYKKVLPKETFPEAKQAALKAIELAPNLAEAHTSLALVAWLHDWDWEGADREFRRAIELNPRYPTAPHWYALYLAEMGRFEEAVASVKRALDLDPASVYINADFGRVLFYARRYDESLEQYRKTMEMDPNFIAFYVELSYLYEQLGLVDERFAPLAKLYGRMPEWQGADLKLDIKAYWRKWLEASRPNQTWTLYYTRAEAYARLDEKDEVFAMLDQAYDVRDHQMAQLKVNPAFDSLRSDPRFQELLRRMNFAP